MANEQSIELIDATTVTKLSELSIIMEKNFTILKNNIDNVNNLISFLDTIHIVQEYPYDKPGTSKNALITDFTNTWATLNNYEALIIGTINYGGDSHSFSLSGFTGNNNTIEEGCIVIRVPGGCGLILAGLPSTIYTPKWDETTGVITYNASKDTSVTHPDVVVSTQIATNIAPIMYMQKVATCTTWTWAGQTKTYAGDTIDIIYPRFFMGNGAQVFFENELALLNIAGNVITVNADVQTGTQTAANILDNAAITNIIVEVVEHQTEA